LNSTSSPVSIARPGSYSVVVVATNIGADPTSLISSSYAIDAATGNIWAWGNNTLGQLGNNTMTGSSSPVSIARPGSYSAISAYDYTVAAIDALDGSLWTWGLNALGSIGDGTTISRSSPVSVLGGRSYTSVAIGSAGIYAMTSNGTIYCAGLDSSNYFGRQATLYTTSLIPVLSTLSFTKINSSIYLDSSGNVYCSGPGGAGSLGNNTMDDSVSPVSISRPGSYTDIAMTFLNNTGVIHTLYTTCAAIDGATGNIWTWGYNFKGQLGNNTMTSTSSPVSIARPGSYSAISGSVGGNFAAIEASTGNVYVWGYNGNGQLGNNSLTATSSPVSIARPGSYSYVYASSYATLFIDGTTGMIYGSGINSSGQLGTNTIATRSSPVSLARPGSYKMVVMCSTSSYAIDASDGSLWAWGANSLGQLGNGNTTSTSSPVSVLGGRSYVSLLGSAHTGTVFMLDSSGTVWALGDNSSGQFGNGMTVSSSSPISLAIQSVKFISKTSNPGTLLIIDALSPVVDTQPSNAIKVQGETAQFSVVAHGNPSL
jgi:alpha-tubulin suppressor-like RCC1 family protein